MTHVRKQTNNLLSSSLAHSLEPSRSPPPSPLILTKEQKRSSRLSPATLNNHLNNLTTMAGQTSAVNEEDYSLFLSENGHLSFENPNYHMDPMAAIDPARLDDHLNSNVPGMSVFDEIRISERQNCRQNEFGRKGYASLDIASMGVDVTKSPKTNLDNKIIEEKMKDSIEKLDRLIEQEVFLKGDKESDKLEESDKEKMEKSDGEEDTAEEESHCDKVVLRSKVLPRGWEKHTDEDGDYYWHVKTGTIQREEPIASEEEVKKSIDCVVRDARSSHIFDDNFDPMVIGGMTKSGTSNSVADMDKEVERLQQQSSQGGVSSSKGCGKNSSSSSMDNMVEDKKLKRRSMPAGGRSSDSTSSEEFGKAIQIQVRSLGSVELREDELTPENSSKSVNRCIVQLSTSEMDVTSTSSKLGHSKDMVLELHDGSLKLLSTKSGSVLHSQPIHSIRVWGVGRDNGQDFAYVAKDKQTRKHMCHVFRCEVPARAIANALRDICKKILIERSLVQSSTRLGLQQQQQQHSSGGVSGTSGKNSNRSHSEVKLRRDRMRPTSLGTNFNTKLQTKTVPAPESFPTPMEEPRKVMKGWFLGTLQVNKPCGMDVIKGAIEELMNSVPRAQWKTATVAVAPSTITITFGDRQSEPLDCRVRFLSFLGIGENPQQCSFIMHTAQDTFLAYVFHCEPTAGPLCKTIEAACKLRYQKCLDARPQREVSDRQDKPGSRSSIGSTLKNMLGSWRKGEPPS